jgi:copper homeostasis protein
MKLIKEACVETKSEIDFAARNSADRIELCDNLKVGGLTPSWAMTQYALSKKLSVAQMIRVNDNFTANDEELSKMQEQISYFVKTDIDAFVFGLVKDKKVDVGAMEHLIKCCHNKDIVFHMAFDEIEDKFNAVDILKDMGVCRILTKGGQGRALDNIDMLKKLNDYSRGKLQIMAGGGVNENNYLEIANLTGIRQFHGRRIFGK